MKDALRLRIFKSRGLGGMGRWQKGRTRGRGVAKIETRLTDNLERGFRSYFIWANRILRFAVLLLVAFLIYNAHGRFAALEDINLGE